MTERQTRRSIYVCITCTRQASGEPDSAPRPGALLAAATERAAAGTEVAVRRLRCLANCTRGPSAAMRCNGSWTYVFGGLDVDCAEALVEGARLLAARRRRHSAVARPAGRAQARPDRPRSSHRFQEDLNE